VSSEQSCQMSDKVYQLLDHGRWFSLSTLASSITKTGRHDIAEILLKVALISFRLEINCLMISTLGTFDYLICLGFMVVNATFNNISVDPKCLQKDHVRC
jgi:hypothetical protein